MKHPSAVLFAASPAFALADGATRRSLCIASPDHDRPC